MKLNPEKQLALTKDALEAILREYGIADFTFSPITSGVQNSSALVVSGGKQHVLRVYVQERKNDEDVKREIRFQDFLRDNGIPIPKIYRNKSEQELTILDIAGKKWQIILMEFMEGQSVTEHPGRELIAELASMQARMHLLGIKFNGELLRTEHAGETEESFGEMINRWYKDLHDNYAVRIVTLPIPGEEIAQFVERVKAYRYRLDPRLPHGYNHLDLDFHGNVLVSHSKITGVIDFDDLAYSPMIVCLGYTVWSMLANEGIECARTYVNEYEKVRPLSDLEREAMPHVVMFRNYMLGALRLYLWDETSHAANVMKNLELEKEIPKINFFA